MNPQSARKQRKPTMLVGMKSYGWAAFGDNGAPRQRPLGLLLEDPTATGALGGLTAARFRLGIGKGDGPQGWDQGPRGVAGKAKSGRPGTSLAVSAGELF